MDRSGVYDCYIGIMAKSSSLAALSSIKMATAVGQLVLASAIESLGLPGRVYNLDVTDWFSAEADIISLMQESKRPLVGFTLVAGNVEDSLRLATWFKARGADIILGGPEITPLTVSYYSSFLYVDGVILGTAENILPQIMVKGLGLLSNNFLEEKSELDFKNLKVNYKLLYGLKEDHSGVSYVWGGDCHLRNNRCFFCSRQSRGFGFRDPEKIWKELEIPFTAGKRYYYNTADSIAVRPDKFAQFVKARPSELQTTMHKTFINAVQVNDEIAELLFELNALAAIGVESFSNLSAAGKGKTTKEDNFQAIDVLARHQVKMVLTFVLGLPGETSESLKQNAETLLRVVEKYSDHIFMITVSPLLVTIGSRAFDVLTKKYELPPHIGQAYYDPLKLSELYCKYFCKVERQEIMGCIAQLHQTIQDRYPEIEFDSKGISIEEKGEIES